MYMYTKNEISSIKNDIMSTRLLLLEILKSHAYLVRYDFYAPNFADKIELNDLTCLFYAERKNKNEIFSQEGEQVILFT